jgi:hypothetical protein
MIYGPQLVARRSNFDNTFDFIILDRRSESIAFATEIKFESHRLNEMGGVKPKPTFQLDEYAAQALMNELWNAGLRPSDGTGNSGQLGAVENHLSDLRTIAFHLLKIGGAR